MTLWEIVPSSLFLEKLNRVRWAIPLLTWHDYKDVVWCKLGVTLGLRTPDTIHVATALFHSCSLIGTNDGVFRRIPDLPVAVLNELVL